MAQQGNFKHLWGAEVTDVSNQLKKTSKQFYLKYSNLKFYESMTVEDLRTGEKEKVKVGGYVMIAGNPQKPGYYVGEVESFFDLHEKDLESTRASVRWFYMPYEIPKRLQVRMHQNEVVSDLRLSGDVVDADSIVGTCHVTKLQPNQQIPDSCMPDNFFFSKGFDGKRLIDLNKPEQLKQLAPKPANKRGRQNAVVTKTPAKKTSKAAAVKKSKKEAVKVTQKSNKKPTSSNHKISTKDAMDQLVNGGDSDGRDSNAISSDDDDFVISNISKNDEPKKVEKKVPVMKKQNLKNEPSMLISQAIPKKKSKIEEKLSPSSTTTDSTRPRRVTAGRNQRYDGDLSSLAAGDNTSDTDEDEFNSDAAESASSEEEEEEEEEESFVEVKKKRKRGKNVEKKTMTTSKKSTVAKHPRSARIPARPVPLDPNKSVPDCARHRLHVSTIPDYLPCREDKFESIFSFVHSHLTSGTGGCMFISGVPGTGKTATVNEVMKTLHEMVAEEEEVKEFNYISINGMKLTEPHQAFVSILKQLKGVKTSPSNAEDILSKHFQQRNKKSTVLLVDELDLLWTKKQDVLYHLFNWPTHGHARLIVISIANTMDLPERVMTHRVASRLGMTRTSFLPYTYPQLQNIVKSRIEELDIFQADAIELAARKVASVSGDARRCLDVCRRSIDFMGGDPRIGIKQIQSALQEMFSTPIIKLIRNCSEHEKLILMAIVAEYRKLGVEEAMMSQVLKHHNELCAHQGLQKLSVATVTEICLKLSASRLISTENHSNGIHSRIRLNVAVDDVLFAVN